LIILGFRYFETISFLYGMSCVPEQAGWSGAPGLPLCFDPGYGNATCISFDRGLHESRSRPEWAES
jgi:hypothetical protein